LKVWTFVPAKVIFIFISEKPPLIIPQKHSKSITGNGSWPHLDETKKTSPARALTGLQAM
jgi:hypothetical protein